MAKIKPFKGIRPPKDFVEQVASRPYDVLNSEEARQEACDSGRVMLNDKVARASAEVKVGDVIEIAFGNKSVRAQVLQVADTSRKEEAKEMFKYL